MNPESDREAMLQKIEENRGLVEEFFSPFEFFDPAAAESLSPEEKQQLQDELVFRMARTGSPDQILNVALPPAVVRFLGDREFFAENLKGRDQITLGLVNKRLGEYLKLVV